MDGHVRLATRGYARATRASRTACPRAGRSKRMRFESDSTGDLDAAPHSIQSRLPATLQIWRVDGKWWSGLPGTTVSAPKKALSIQWLMVANGL
jgi:hypothetical protein